MPTPRKAFLLAAGFGTRMRPLSNAVPKPLMPLWGRPVIEHVIDLLASWGVCDILVNLHHSAGDIVAHLQGRTGGPRLQFSFEPDILGTGGGLARGRWFFDDGPFWIVNTDIAADLAPGRFLKALRSGDALAALWMHPAKGPRTVEMVDGWIRDFRSRPPGAEGTFTFCGLQLVSPAVFPFLQGERFHSIVDAYEAALAAGRGIRGVVVPNSYWSDLGTPADYLAAHRDVLHASGKGLPGARLMDGRMRKRVTAARRAGATIRGFAAIGANVRIRAGACIEDSVLWDEADVGARATVRNAILGERTTFRANVSGTPVVRAVVYNAGGAFRSMLESIGFAPERTVVCPLPTRGSNRSFARLACGRCTAMLIHYNRVRPENARFAGHARFLLREGVPVPRILLDRPRRQVVIAEDVGDRSLEDAVKELSERAIERHYQRVLDALLTLHRIPASRLKTEHVRLEPAFSARVYAWERELFAKYYLRGCRGLSRTRVEAILRELAGVARRLVGTPLVIVHRDMQSSNVLLRRGGPVLIDFQGMRLGPAAYDLASLLCDPYVMLHEPLQERLFEYYLARCESPRLVRELFVPAAVQRLAQALGAYGRLGVIPGTERFRDYIPAALRMLLRIVARSVGLPALEHECREALDYHSSRTT